MTLTANIQIPSHSYIPLTLKQHRYSPGYRTKPIRLKRHSIGFVHAGRGKLFINGKSHAIQTGSFFFLQPAMRIIILSESSSDNAMQLSLLQYQGLRVRRNTDDPSPISENGLFETLSYVSNTSPAITDTLLGQLQRTITDCSELGSMRTQSLFYELLLHLHDRLERSEQSVDESIQRTIVYMEQHYAKQLAISDMPQLAGMTNSSYCRAFKKLTGMTPGHYLTRLRILKAKEMMTGSHTPLRDIAVSVGYQDELYFSRVFKKTEGISPSVFLKRRDKKITVVSTFLLQDHLLALGILPVAAPSYPNYYKTATGFPSYLQDRLSGVVPLNAEKSISSSDVIRLSPDMIIRTEFGSRSAIDQSGHWSETAPHTIVINHSTTWEQYLRAIALRVRREAEAERIIRQLTAVEQEARRKLESVTNRGKWVVIRLLEGKCRLYGVREHTLTELLYNRLQFRPDERVSHGIYMDDAFDTLIELDPDNILVIWSEEQEWDAFSAKPRWQDLQAVKHNRIYYPDSREWDPWGPIGREYMIRAMIRYFEKK
ncbi:helix-turn-helix domain-containing protein [Paenibacillus sp. YIM B09110]|uniref:helix-turn-helix domain-containing protein n=1 Tax=Paenibacillus sp. YIM B09110 TaxID=3126102 RepID=UPI00301C0C21